MSKRRSDWTDDEPALGRRLYQDRDEGIFFGICAGLADFFGFDLTLTRVITAIAGLIFFPTVAIGYLILALLLPKRPRRRGSGGNAYSRSLRRHVRSAPHSTLDNVRYRFRELEARLQRLESYLTSSRYKLDREFESLRD